MEHFTTYASSVTAEDQRTYQTNGFIRVRGIISPEEAAEFRVAADKTLAEVKEHQPGDSVFRQYVNTWRINETLKKLTLHPTIASIAEKLAGTTLRLWHDHLLVKAPSKSTPTHFHQDQPFWPHANSTQPISCWVALNDVPVERGAMTFIPGSQKHTDLRAQDLRTSGSLFELAPGLVWDERVSMPLKAGDCTFHHGRTAHMANANTTEENRYGFAIIYVDTITTFTGTDHPVTDALRDSGDLKTGGELNGEIFPALS